MGENISEWVRISYWEHVDKRNHTKSILKDEIPQIIQIRSVSKKMDNSPEG